MSETMTKVISKTMSSAAAVREMAGSVLFVCDSFPPSMEMGARTCSQIARYLKLYGWDPTILTVQEKYIEEHYRERKDTLAEYGLSDSIVRAGLLPHPLDFYRWIKLRFGSGHSETGVAATGAGGTGADRSATGNHEPVVSELPEDGEGGLRRWLISVLGIPDFFIGWLIPATIAGLQTIRRTNAQVIFSSAPYFTDHLVGMALSRLSGLPWVAHFRDPFVAGAAPCYLRTSTSVRLNRMLERMVISQADRVVCVTEEHADALREAYTHCAADKFLAVPNGFDGEEWKDLETERGNPAQKADRSNGKFRIMYAGKLYVQRSPLPLFRALRKMIDAGEIRSDQVQVDLVGWCETSEGRSIEDLITETRLNDCVKIVGPLSRPNTLRQMMNSDLLLLLAEGWTTQIPGKTYEYIKAGRPILALTSKGALANFIKRTKSGWAVDPAQDEAILTAVRESYRQWRSNEVTSVADPAVVAGYDRRLTTRRLCDLFDELADSRQKNS